MPTNSLGHNEGIRHLGWDLEAKGDTRLTILPQGKVFTSSSLPA